MTKNIAKCGCDCFNCPTYRDNIKSIDERKICSSGWEKYLNIKLSPERLRECDGCSISDDERKIYYLNCKIRKCAIINEIDNCAYCKGYPCDELLKAHSVQKINSKEEFIEKTGKEISDCDYYKFIEPYLGLGHLNKIRQSLSKNDFKDFKKHSSKTKFAQIDKLNDKTKSIQIIYSLLTKICIDHDISYARLQTTKKKREQLLKIIWTLALYGNFVDNNVLELDSKTFISQKIQGMYNILSDYLNDLKSYNIHCEIIPLKDNGWLTSTGGLRKEGWKLTCRFGKPLNGVESLVALKKITIELNNKFGNKAFSRFSIADISI